MIFRLKKLLSFGLVSFTLVSCSEMPFHQKQQALQPQERFDQAEQRLKNNPTDKDAKVDLANQRYRLINQYFAVVTDALKANDTELAKAYLGKILQIEANNPRALDTLKQLNLLTQHDASVVLAQDLLANGNSKEASKILRQVLIENPNYLVARKLLQDINDKDAKDQITPRKLKLKAAGTVTLDFRDANLRNIFQVISISSGINIVLDPNLRPDLKASIYVKDASVVEVLDFLLLMHQLNKKVLTENSILIYPIAKAAQYEDLVLRTYYLNHADAKQTANLIKAMMPIKDIFIDERLNMIAMKATYEQLQDIEKLINNEDLPNPEVLLDVEVLEVKRTRLTDIGFIFPDKLSVIASPSGPVLNDLKNITSNRIAISSTSPNSPALSLNLLRQDADSNLLANPRIRVLNREKAKIHIGDKIPIPVTTIGSGNNNFVGQSANYLDVGLKLDVEPRVLLDNNVAIRIGLEVSSATFASGPFPTIGTRNTSTVMMVADGETQVLAGLINDEDRKNTRKVPGLSDIPLLGRLFNNPNNNKSKTEIVLLITPHVLRNIQRPDSKNTEFYGGTSGRTAPLNINPAAMLQQIIGAPIAQPPANLPTAPAVPAPAAPATLPFGGNQLGKPVGSD